MKHAMERLTRLPFIPGDIVPVNAGAFFHKKKGLDESIPAEVVGYDSIRYGRTNNYGMEPGIYSNPSWIKVREPGGLETHVYVANLDPITDRDPIMVERGSMRLGDLPDTPFWEMDEVVGPEGEPMQVTVVRSEMLSMTRNDGSPYPIYECEAEFGEKISLSDDQLILAERGNVWRRAHGLDMVFSGLEEEAEFYIAVGEYQEVVNPETNLFRWTPEEVDSAIVAGTVDCYAHGLARERAVSNYSPIIFENREVGERVREEMLSRLEQTPAGISPR